MNVLVVVVDALRHDALSTTHADGTPTALGRRIESWIHLDGCRAAAPWTYPATTSLLTGVDPLHHCRYDEAQPVRYKGLVEGLATDHKAAVINNGVVQHMSGVDEQFDEYMFVPDARDAFLTAQRIIAARQIDGRSWFLLMHSNIVHDYYLPSARAQYERYFPDRDDYFDIEFRVLGWSGGVRDRAADMRRIYDACVLHVHDEIEGLLAEVPLDDTIVVITADHGEGFDPARARIHHGGRVHDDVVRVPCAIGLPASVPAGARARLAAARCHSTSAIDLLPTLIDLTGGPVPDDVDGHSLVRAEAAERRVLRIEDQRYLYLSSRLRLNTNTSGKNTTRRDRILNRCWGRTVARHHRVRGFVDGKYKLVVTTMESSNRVAPRFAARLVARAHNGTPAVVVRDRSWNGLELFDLAADPGEEHNLLLGRGHRGRAARALAIADAYAAGDGTPRLAELLAT